MKKQKLIAHGEVYNVREEMTDENGVHGEWDDYPDWYEYKMFLVAPGGEIISEWDSLTETYNGMQKLTRADCEKSVKEIVKDVKAGKISHWFSHVPEKYLVKEKYSVSGKSRRKPRSGPATGIGSTR